MQNDRNQQGQSMAPAIDYLNQVQRIYFDSWRRCGDAGVRWTRDAMDECSRIGQDILNAPLSHYQSLGEKLGDYQQDMLHMMTDAQTALARSLSESTRATADLAREMAEQQADQIARGSREQADAWREQAGQAAGQAREQAQNMQQAQHGQHAPERHEGGADKRHSGTEKGAAGGKGGQDKLSSVHQRAGT